MLIVNSVTCCETLDSAFGLCTSFGTTKLDVIFGTWNVTGLYGSVSLKAVAIKQTNCK
jgi:hypothetical protein